MLPPPGPDFPDRGLSPPIVLRLELSFPGSQHLGGLPWREYGDVPPPPPVLVEDDSGEVVMRITKPVHQEILDALTSRRPEAGGILLGPGTITRSPTSSSTRTRQRPLRASRSTTSA